MPSTYKVLGTIPGTHKKIKLTKSSPHTHTHFLAALIPLGRDERFKKKIKVRHTEGRMTT